MAQEAPIVQQHAAEIVEKMDIGLAPGDDDGRSPPIYRIRDSVFGIPHVLQAPVLACYGSFISHSM